MDGDAVKAHLPSPEYERFDPLAVDEPAETLQLPCGTGADADLWMCGARCSTSAEEVRRRGANSIDAAMSWDEESRAHEALSLSG
jgi:hypothetical protein